MQRSAMHSPHASLLLLIGTVLAALASGPEAKADPEPKAPANRLAKETSPYLLLHAHNPVDWYPWGPEAFAKAKAEKKPIFLSIGYSSCYWCHVMERECFKDPQIAKLMNQKFVCIKVDREERPDIDQIYMAALQAFGNGGWPMSMFLTPDGRPFFGGTYFPPKDRNGIRGFPTVLAGVADAWRDEKAQIEESADRLTDLVRRSLAKSNDKRHAPLTRAVAAQGREELTEQFDPEYGGFGFNPENARRPKFPEPVNLVFLLDEHRRGAAAGKKEGQEASSNALAMVLKTLDQMARGGIRDQLAGGYHRYATSRYWIVPHFEKMLYDNAQLASTHLLAFELTADPRWRLEAESTFAFIARSMTSPEGGFYSAIDAETDGDEGQYYVWTRDEVEKTLGAGPDYEAFAQVYGLKREPNFEKERYVLLEPRSRADQAATLKTTPAALEATMAPLRAKLLAVRERRPAPLLDDKVLTSWNGLMIAAYADGFRILHDAKYRQAADKAADFILAKLRSPDGRLLRSYRLGQAKLAGYLEDYAFLVHGLLRLHAATGDPKRLTQARELTDRMIADFSDPEEGGFFYTADGHESLLARPKDPYDGALPSGNSVAIRNLVALASATGEARYLDQAQKALDAFSSTLAQNPGSLPLLVVALGEYLDARPTAAAVAVPTPEEAPADSDAMVTAKGAVAAGSTIAPGEEFAVDLTVKVKKGWHLNANPAGSENLIPTTVALARNQPAKVSKVEYPAGDARVLEVGNAPVPLYEGTVTLKARVRLDAEAKQTPDALTFEVRYQACNDNACLAPTSLSVRVPLGGGR
ncbi:DUF255 domain-containing protein [Singulisphaera acidiphila]|uniref:Thioredoxin domain protein n=1 Tax=Singulisphaera acidiphila (strain ATCC BAA-1392 / DSM 18658 / VKM B-2454 / MOB10) TaxID=886293 RepID=L0DIV9_SINAD|nr:DUF255 domain-containing protein [Singulisphaera acidiphila]AGA29197.1 thioredoxin domain protein [Singulisphaera acidiphila DSM 18658]